MAHLDVVREYLEALGIENIKHLPDGKISAPDDTGYNQGSAAPRRYPRDGSITGRSSYNGRKKAREEITHFFSLFMPFEPVIDHDQSLDLNVSAPSEATPTDGDVGMDPVGDGLEDTEGEPDPGAVSVLDEECTEVASTEGSGTIGVVNAGGRPVDFGSGEHIPQLNNLYEGPRTTEFTLGHGQKNMGLTFHKGQIRSFIDYDAFLRYRRSHFHQMLKPAGYDCWVEAFNIQASPFHFSYIDASGHVIIPGNALPRRFLDLTIESRPRRLPGPFGEELERNPSAANQFMEAASYSMVRSVLADKARMEKNHAFKMDRLHSKKWRGTYPYARGGPTRRRGFR
ncbi:hypothetical protein AMATHDRAFT_51102 [Amanita thiersii Skay4041]|uniref:Uncharacterized protein n=1 Tax=Amanita thiersii Skay4041 TaxID=703135 RepID=A0A2A9NF66_9AGAR|nr:hypothetical protein AMATHDRAFT_51102 [Amanita thiersii Skay4041]